MRSDSVKSAVAVTGAFLLVLALGTLGWALLRSNPSSDAGATWQDAAANPSESPSVTPTTEAPATTPPPPSPTAKPRATKNVVPKSTTTKQPPAKDLPPPPKEKPVDPACQTKYVGPDASNAQVRAALAAAAGRPYWVGVVPDPNLTVPRPTITVPVDLMNAVAFQESSWRANVVSCDTGVGVMQITETADTANFVNLRFGEDFDVNTLSGNASIGAAFIEWLIMYFGIYFYSQHFDLSTVGAVGPKGEQVALLDAVLAAYNIGYGKVIASVTNHTLSIPPGGQTYANEVKALRTTCPCINY